MVANFNLTWKGPCLEILNYVGFSLRPGLWRLCMACSLPRGLLVRSSRSVKHPSSGASGRGPRRTNLLTDSGHVVKPQRPKTMFSTGEHRSLQQFHFSRLNYDYQSWRALRSTHHPRPEQFLGSTQQHLSLHRSRCHIESCWSCPLTYTRRPSLDLCRRDGPRGREPRRPSTCHQQRREAYAPT